MELRIFKDGELIEIRQIEQSLIPPDVSQYSTQMLLSLAYNKLSQLTPNQNARIRLEIAITRLELKPDITNEDLQLLKLIWDSTIENIVDSLSPDDLAEYRLIASQNYMPFNFKDDFTMEITAR
ncbi:MAG: hypothetical protein KME23_17675 [Goleter apudmare HA4340-LM2]|jgi:hypothetical protein|nr:hypothetical protein [Goleter apudmare HA4340-LM2]MBW4644791.1 hypothetical protein [Goleter apudmare HA4340-LM2]